MENDKNMVISGCAICEVGILFSLILQGVYSEVISITHVGVNKNDIADASSVLQIQSEMNRALFLCLISGISRLKTLCCLSVASKPIFL